MLNPRAHLFLDVELKRRRLVGSVDRCPAMRKNVPSTNMDTTIPVTVYSMNHSLQTTNEGAV